jgi:hypothetical protein
MLILFAIEVVLVILQSSSLLVSAFEYGPSYITYFKLCSTV